jgi:hypothetical protein
MGLLKETAHNYYSGNDLGNYQFTSLDHVINNFMIGYVGDGKIIPKVKRTDVLFYAQRALQEFSYDTLKSIKSQEITLPPSSVMSLPQDYVNYVKLTWSDNSGVEHIIYPTSKTSNPNSVAQDSDGNYVFNTDTIDSSGGTANGLMQFPLQLELQSGLTIAQTTIDIFPHLLGFDPTTNTLTTNPGFENFPDTNPFEVGMEIVSPYFPAGTTISTVTESTDLVNMSITLSNASNNTVLVSGPIIITVIDKSTTWENYESPASLSQTDYDDELYNGLTGERYGLDPQYTQTNGSFFIDELQGKVHFSSNISGKTVILKYISDGLGTDSEMVVHKFAEEAMYKHIAYAILSTRANVQEYLVARFKKEKFAETRKAKLRLSNIKIEELTQILRGKSKQIKH